MNVVDVTSKTEDGDGTMTMRTCFVDVVDLRSKKKVLLRRKNEN